MHHSSLFTFYVENSPGEKQAEAERIGFNAMLRSIGYNSLAPLIFISRHLHASAANNQFLGCKNCILKVKFLKWKD